MKTVQSLIILFVGLIFAGSPAAAMTLAEVNQRLADGQTTRVVCFGDSITGVYYHSGGQRAWCDMLGFALQKAHPRASLQMINAGISGHTTANALSRIQNDVIARQPHLVVVMFGMNDVTRIPLNTFRDNMRSICKQCLAAGSAVVLCTPNSVSPNTARPEEKLAQYAAAVRDIGSDMQLPVVDCFQDWKDFRAADPTAWSLIMSDQIHPNMTGHIRFAELMAHTISGRKVSLNGTPTARDALQHTFDRLSKSESVKLIAMPPYDELLPELLRQQFPEATFDITTWPTAGQSVTELAGWAKQIRSLKPDLVVPAVPASAVAKSQTAFIRDYEWVLNHSFQFAGRPWDVAIVSPTVDGQLSEPQQANSKLARQIILGKDTRFVDRNAGDERPARKLLAAWIAEQRQAWQGLRNQLPHKNASVLVPVQSWPHQPGPRSVRVTLHYPGGSLESVTPQTGIMLSLHNWGGTDCAGTANPPVLAQRLNVIAVCVNYLQSGRTASTESPAPYDCGYLQALDALRALAFVRNGLKQSGRTWDDGRLFCTGGSGGGNVTLMANKLAPRTFACVIDLSGMKKLSDDIAFNLPGGTSLNARWSRNVESVNYLSADQQSIRFVGQPEHLAVMKGLQPTSKIVIVHGVDDTTCPFADARELVTNLQSAKLDVESHFIGKDDIDGRVFTNSGHGLGNRTEIVLRVAEKYLAADSLQALRRNAASDFDRGQDIRYPTQTGAYLISYKNGYPTGSFQPNKKSAESN